MTGGVAEAGSPRPPRPVKRPVEQRYATVSELLAQLIYVLDLQGEYDAGPAIGVGDPSRGDEL